MYRNEDLREALANVQTELVFEPEIETVLALFPDRDDDGISRRYGLLLGPDGLPRPGSRRFRAALGAGGEESTSAVALPGEGFLVAVERAESDGTGIVALCDNRLNSKAYGRGMLESLPPMRRSADLEEVLSFARELGPVQSTA